MKPDQSNRLPHPPAEYFVASSARLNVTRLLALCAILLMSLLVCIPSSVYSHQPMSSPPTPPMQGHGAQRTAPTARTLSPPALVSRSVSASVGDVAVDVGGNTIKKLNGADGTVLWSAPISNVGTNEAVLAVDQLDLGVYTGNGSHIIGGTSTVYKYTASGELAWTNTISRSGTCGFYRVTGAAVDTTSSSPGVVWTQSGCYGGIAKSDRTTGVQQWSVYTNDIGRPSIDPSNGDIYAITTSTWYQIYKATTTGSLTSAASCNGQSDLNPADGMLYRGGGDCGLTLAQMNNSSLGLPNWSMDLSGTISSFDTLAVQPWSGGYIYVASMSSSKIVVVNPSTQTVVTSFTTAVAPSNIAVNPSGGNLYITNGASHFVYAYSPTGSLVWTSPDLGGPVYNVAAPMGIVGTASPLGNYPDTTVALGGNTTVTPDAPPTNASSINVSSSTNFKGTFFADPATGVVRVTNAHPAGIYPVTVTAFNSIGVATTKTFTLTVTTPVTCNPVSFAATTNLGVGDSPSSVAIADFNNDGKQDIAVANGGSNTVSIRLGDGLGGFSGTTDVSVGTSPTSVAIGDFNGDGKQDLAVANGVSSNVSILLGTGTGSFGAATNFGVGAGPLSVAVGDFNGDGHQDLATANTSSDSSHFVSVLLGTGTGSFGAATDFAVGYRPYSVAVGDFNGDGKQDLAVANESFASLSVSILLGTGTGSFGAATNFGVGGDPVSVAVGDFNGDGIQDLATANYWTSNLSILLGTGTGSFAAATDIGVGFFPYLVVVGDFNGDGQQDLATANRLSDYISILLGTGTGSFGAATNFGVGTGPFSVAVGDFNGDGQQDIAAANIDSSNASVLLRQCQPTLSINSTATQTEGDSGQANMTFTVTLSATSSQTVTVNYSTANGSVNPALGGGTCGGAFDYVTTTGTLTFNPGDTAKTIDVPICGDTTHEPDETFTVTLDTPTDATIASGISTGTITDNDPMPTFTIDDVTHNEGNGGTTAFIFTVTKTGSTALNLSVDFTTVDGSATIADNDYQAQSGTLNFLPTDTTKTITVLVNGDTTFETDETFTVHLSGATIGAPSTAVGGTGTITNDDVAPPTLGNYPDTTVQAGANTTVTPDAAPTNTTSMNVSTTSAFKGTFTASPTTGVVMVTNAQPAGTYTVTVTAFNSAGVTATKTFTLTITNPTHCDLLSFSGASGSPFTVGLYPWSVAVGDFNGDGKQDLATANRNSENVTVLLGDGSGSFSAVSGSPFAVGSDPYSVAVGDFNGDGTLDLTTANLLSDNVTVLLGNGTGGFSPASGSPFAVSSRPYSVSVGDFNGDGKLDLTTANYLSNNVTVLLGNGSGGFSAATGSPFAVGSGPRSVAVGDFNGDGKLDLTTANQSSPSTVTVLLGSGGGGFSPATGSPFALGGTSPYSVAVGDLNRDGKLDIMTANVDSNNVTALLGDGSGGFSPASGSPFTVGTHPFSFTVGDFNGDGKLDLTTANYNSNNVTVLLGDGSGGLSAASGSPFAFGPRPLSPAAGDFNSDGKLDLAIGNEPSSNVTVLLNTCTSNTAPTISAVGVTRQQGSPSATATIANVNDLEDLETALTVTVNGGASATVNGVTVSGISVSAAGVVTANVVASCTATTATFTLRVTDTGGLFNEATLTVTVNPNTAPTLTYASPQSVIFGGSLNVSPTATGDNGSVTYSVQAGHGLTPPPSVDANGVVSVTIAQPAGAHTITIRATDNCGAFTDAVFTLNVGSAPTFAIDDVTHNEGNAGTTAYTFTVTKTGSTALNSSVNFTTVDGAATTANNDYQANAGTLTFLPTDTTKTITVLVNGDTTLELNEAFTVHLSGPSGATISDDDGTGTIINDDSPPTFAIDDVTHNEGNAGTTSYTFTVTKTGSTALSSSVIFTTVNGSATTANNDYQLNTGALNFLDTDTTKQITVLVNGDTTVEPDEAFTVHLSGASGATISDADGTGTITNDDVAPPMLGNYPNTTVQAGANTTVTPDAAPTNTTSMNVSTTSAFNGTFAASPTTGVVQVTDAQPAGTYSVTVTAFNSAGVTTMKTFTLTITNPMHCDLLSFSGASGSPFTVGSGPYSVAVGDFNGDGKQDVATANDISNNVTVLLGNGSGGFSPASGSPFVVGAFPHSVAVGDFNGDGKLDLTTANSTSNNVTVLLGNGSGGFSPATGSPFAVGADPRSVAVGDFNGDGKQDLTASNWGSSNVTVLLGDGSGGFTPATGSPFALGLAPQSVAVGDFNGDGKQDLTTANWNSNNVAVLLGNGSGGFSAAAGSPFAVGSEPYSVAVGDFNGDGKQDLATANVNSNNVTVLLGDGSGGFSPASGSPFTIGTNPISVAVGDFNGDGKQDLTTANPGSNNVTVLLGNGSGGFIPATASPFAVGSEPISVAVGDFNGDGKLDLTISNHTSNKLTVLLNTCTQNTAPTISAIAVTRQQGSPSGNATIANVNDLEDLETALTVTINGGASATVNGVTVSGISVSGAGVVTADVIASCTATTPTFTLRVTDTFGVFNEATLTVTVNPNTAPMLTYSSPEAVVFGGALNVTPTAASDNGGVTYSVQPGHGLTTAPTVDAIGVVSITNAQPAGAHTITIRATDNCGAFTDATFTLNVGDLPTFTIDDVTHNEGNSGTTSFVFTVTKTGSTPLTLSVDFTTVDGTATIANNDYQANSGTLNFLPTDTTRTITVLVNGDTTFESDEAFTVHLSGATFGGLHPPSPGGTGTIINDDACSFSLSGNGENFSAAGGMSSVNVITGTGCAWIAVSNDAFITVNSGTPGSGNGTVNYTVAANTGPARTGTMTIAGITFTVTQDAGCTFTLNRDHQSFPGNGGNGTVNITASDAGCAWTASTTSLFITITSGGSGTGNGAVQYTVAINAGTTIRSDTITIAGHTFTVYQGTNFLDVPSNDPFYNDIGKLAARGVTLGCTADHTLYCPNDPVTREQMAAFILRAKGEFNPPTPGSQRFNDVPPTNVFYSFIDRLAELQITLGCTPDHLMYCPSDPVKREQMSAFILRGLGEFNPPTPSGQRFEDVPPANVFYNFIDRLAVLQITLGCTPDHLMYCPGDSVTRAQMAAFLVRAFNL